jgi:hypothetical protein
LVDVASDGEAGIGSSGADQLNDDLVADERFAAPVLGDIGKEAVLDAVPFAGAGRQMGDGYNEAGFVGKALEFTLLLNRHTGTVQTPKLCKKPLSQFIIAPRAQASAMTLSRPTR